ncbi:hypothetical protein C0216_01910 [Streptomyces globosus]|uniref:Uncharacterized protein n=1 Tax=Streptomyces globosus TaxID=68209 RepID=A0A344TUN8_9ACTN|nr:hypothetical protein [Streptomyces globosus]AXE22359.1 hypothetical protein C0216_01910 [Streptomyces globosus]
MPTPYGTRGGMAFSAAELRVLRRTLARALQPSPAPPTAAEVQDCLHLAQAVDDAAREAGRLRAFLLADLDRYRRALPGSRSGYLGLLADALAAGCEPLPEDLDALRGLRPHPAAEALLERIRTAAEHPLPRRRPVVGPPRTRLLALAGGREGGQEPPPRPKPGPKEPARPQRPAERPGERPAQRPVPTPGEVFPPRRRPTPPPAADLAAG